MRQPLRVGLLFSQTGLTAFVERTQHNAALLAIEEINTAGGVGGHEIVPIAYDAQSDPRQFARIAEHLLGEDGVSLLLGCYMSNTRQAVVPIVERRNSLFGYTAPYEGFEYSPNVIYGGAVPNQHILLLARYLMANVGRRFYLVGTRYTFPIECNRVMMTLIAEQRGEVVAERYVSLDAQYHDLRMIVDDIKARAPDVVFCTVIGEAAARFYELCREAGIGAIASLTITEAEIGLMPPDAAAGTITAATYFQSVGTAANKRFVRDYKTRFGANETTNAMAETAYSLTHMLLGAIGRCGSLEAEAVRAELASVPFDAPQGEVRLDSDNSHCYLWPRIARIEAGGHFRILAQSRAALKPDPYMINHTLADWDLLPDPILRAAAD
jgi:branched-chain amino acid transport system substrate-binding protein